MDYTQGALEISSAVQARVIVSELGPMGLGNSQFVMRNLSDSISDVSAYALEEERAMDFLYEAVEPMPYISEVSDCDSKCICFCADVIRKAVRHGFKRPIAIFDLWYCSKTLGLPHKTRLAGYHSTPAIIVRTKDDDLKLKIIQPPTLWDSGNVSKIAWQDPGDEVKFWVFINSMG